jgi:AraC-like DNA-binding protein
VIDVALLGIIRRWHIRDQIPLREIARRLGISRNTVRRYLRSETVEPAYAERCSTRAIDKYAFQLSALLKTEAARTRKQRRTLKQIHEDLKELGFEGSYDRVAAFARVWRAGQADRVNPASKRTLSPVNHENQYFERLASVSELRGDSWWRFSRLDTSVPPIAKNLYKILLRRTLGLQNIYEFISTHWIVRHQFR